MSAPPVPPPGNSVPPPGDSVPPPAPGGALWPAVRDLVVRVEAVELERLERETPTMTRVSTHVRLLGGGVDGLGEDVTYEAPEHDALLAWDGLPDLRGERTLAEVCAMLADGPLFPAPPNHDAYLRYRRWAFESAALDLALRQAGSRLDAVLGRTVAPMTFVSSRAVGDPPDPAGIAELRRRSPGLRMKLDLGDHWDAASVARVAGDDAVATVDMKAWYHGTPVDRTVDADVYRAVAEGLPAALLEDAGVTDATREVLLPHAERLTWDVPLEDVADLDALPFPPRTVNLKPSRIGSLAELSAMYEACAARGIGVYSGGQTELGAGRGQAQLLAALFHPDGPNDLAPKAFNDAELPDELPTSPLRLEPAATGFRLAGD